MRTGLEITSKVYPITHQGKLLYAFHTVRSESVFYHCFSSYDEANFARELKKILDGLGITTEN